MTAINITPRTAPAFVRVEARHPQLGWLLLPFTFHTADQAEEYIDQFGVGIEHRIVPGSAGGSGAGNRDTTTHHHPERLTTR